MDILSIILAVAGCIAGLLILWGLVALIIFRVASKRVEKVVSGSHFNIFSK